MTANLEDLHFVEGNVYSRVADIHHRFGGNPQGGVAPSGTFPAIFIFTGEEGERFGYVDAWDEAERVYTFTGEGQVGNMTFVRGNRAIRDHVKNGRSLHLFKKVSRAGGKYVYMGEMQCAGTQVVRGPDREGNERDIIQFELVRLRALEDPSDDLSTEHLFASASIEKLRDKAYAAASPANIPKKKAVRSIYERSRDVTAYALKRAAGRCESCGQPAPFLKPNGQPYLEVHHIDRVSDGGLDAPNKVAAICPTCHRRIHHGVDGRHTNNDLRTTIRVLEEHFSGIACD